MGRARKVNWKRDWAVGERKRVPGYEGIDAYRTKKLDHRGEPVMSFRYHIEGQRPVAVGKTTEGITLEDCVAARQEHIRRIRLGLEGGPTAGLTVGDAMELYLAHQSRAYPSTVHNIRSAWENRLKAHLEHRPLAEVTPIEIQGVLLSILDDGLSPVTVNHYKSILSQTWKHAITAGKYQGANPALLVPAMKTQVDKRYLTEEEMAGFLDYLETECDTTVRVQVNLMLLMGLRRAEIRGYNHRTQGMGIRWENVDLQRAEMSLKRKGNVMHTMPIPEAIVSQLRELGPRESGYVFENLAIRGITRAITEFGLNRGVRPGDRNRWVGMHTFRHTFCTWMGQASGDTAAAQSLMNHRDSKTTALYTHRIPERDREATRKYEQFIQGLRPAPARVIPIGSRRGRP